MAQGKLLGIAIRDKSRGRMQEYDSILVSTQNGCEGDFRGKPGRRQVTVLSKEAWRSACEELNCSLAWTTRRANLLVEGLELADLTGAKIVIGDLILKVTGETDPCHRMDEIKTGLKQSLLPHWRGGVCCRVEQSGHIAIDDTVIIDTSVE